jgi:hypothetical protein
MIVSPCHPAPGEYEDREGVLADKVTVSDEAVQAEAFVTIAEYVPPDGTNIDVSIPITAGCDHFCT